MVQRHSPETTAIGFVSPPRWVSPSMVEFPAVIDGPVLPQQCFPDLPEFDYALECIRKAMPQIRAAARLLGSAGCSAVAMEGTPFAWVGLPDETAARAQVATMAEAADCPAVMAGTAIVDALRALCANRIALCPTYYPPDWRDAWRSFVAGCGFDVIYCLTMADAGITGPIADNDTYGWRTGPELIRRAVTHAADAGAEAIVITGAGCRTTPIIHDLEAIAGCPVVGADGAVFWALARATGLRVKSGALGALTGV